MSLFAQKKMTRYLARLLSIPHAANRARLVAADQASPAPFGAEYR